MTISAQADTDASSGRPVPFDHKRLDRLMEEAGIDLVLATSKHNVQYLLGGHRAQFFDYMDATGITRYLPVYIYPRGGVERATYIGHRLETFQHQVKPLWAPNVHTTANGSVQAMQTAVEAIRKAGFATGRIATEFGFLPYDAANVLRDGFPDAEWVDALYVLERQRTKKSPEELAKLKFASEAVLEAMQAVISAHRPGATKAQLVEALRREETNRGLSFEYCLIAVGASHNRAPSDEVWGEGDILSLDSGGNYLGYISDISRMAIHGAPDTELVAYLDEIETVQQAAFKAVRAGALGREIYAAAEPLVARSEHGKNLEFLAHGMGMVSHEAPRLTDRGPVPYPADDADRPLEAGTVISIETTLKHPSRGFIKLEDTVIVTQTGHEVYGGGGRGWNRGGRV